MGVKKFAWLAVVALGLSFNLCVASQPAVAISKAAPEPAAVASPANSVSRDELQLLKEQNSDLKGFQSDLLLTMWSAFGSLVVLTLALLGFGWFANFRMYERDKELLRKDLEGVVASSESRLQAALESSLATSEKKLRQGVDRLDWKVKHLDTQFQLEREYLGSAATAALRSLELAVELKSEWRIKRSLEGFTDVIDAGGEFYEREVAEALTVLARVPTELRAQADELAPKVRGAKIIPKPS